MSQLERTFQMGFCGDFVEIYKQVPHPKDEGEFFLAFRKKRSRKVLPLFCGITADGQEVMAECFKELRFDPTKLCFLIGRKLGEKSAQFMPLAIQ